MTCSALTTIGHSPVNVTVVTSVWREELNDPGTEIFIITVDGTDCKIWEKKHQRYPIDIGFFSKKFQHAAVKYEIGVAIFHDSIVWVNGPFPGTRHDITILRNDGLKAKMPPGKKLIADLGYRTRRPDEVDMVAFPNSKDSNALKKFKSLARSRHETVNGRIKAYACMFDEFRHSVEKHKLCFYAICVIIQYHLDVGDGCLPSV